MLYGWMGDVSIDYKGKKLPGDIYSYSVFKWFFSFIFTEKTHAKDDSMLWKCPKICSTPVFFYVLVKEGQVEVFQSVFIKCNQKRCSYLNPCMFLGLSAGISLQCST